MSCSTQNCADALFTLNNAVSVYINPTNNPADIKRVTSFGNFKSATDESSSGDYTFADKCKKTFYNDYGKQKIEIDITDFDPSILGTLEGGLSEYTIFDGVTTVASQLDILKA
jgi:hypothetical protein